MSQQTKGTPAPLDAYLEYVLGLYENKTIKVIKHFDGDYMPPVIKAPIAV